LVGLALSKLARGRRYRWLLGCFATSALLFSLVSLGLGIGLVVLADGARDYLD
jgi:hypothetical protein